MIIEGINCPQYGKRSYFVRITEEELRAIAGLDYSQGRSIETGWKVEVSERTNRLAEIESRLEKLKPQIDNLRSLANMIETQIPPITAAIETPPPGKTNSQASANPT